jgi:hypothetical protein
MASRYPSRCRHAVSASAMINSMAETLKTPLRRFCAFTAAEVPSYMRIIDGAPHGSRRSLLNRRQASAASSSVRSGMRFAATSSVRSGMRFAASSSVRFRIPRHAAPQTRRDGVHGPAGGKLPPGRLHLRRRIVVSENLTGCLSAVPRLSRCFPTLNVAVTTI